MKKNVHLRSSNWDNVIDQSGLPELKEYILLNSSNLKDREDSLREKAVSNHSHLSHSLLDPSLQDIHCMHGLHEDINPALMSEIRNRFCVALKGILW